MTHCIICPAFKDIKKGHLREESGQCKPQKLMCPPPAAMMPAPGEPSTARGVPRAAPLAGTQAAEDAPRSGGARVPSTLCLGEQRARICHCAQAGPGAQQQRDDLAGGPDVPLLGLLIHGGKVRMSSVER